MKDYFNISLHKCVDRQVLAKQISANIADNSYLYHTTQNN